MTIGEVGDQIGKQAQYVVGSVADKSAKITSTSTFRAMSGAATAVREEIVEGNMDRIYRPPDKLRMRSENIAGVEQQEITPNTEASGIELHRDSR